MTPEEIQKEWIRLFNESMKNNIFDKTGVTNKDMDDFFKLTLLKSMTPEEFGGQPNIVQKTFVDTAKTQMRFCIETMKVQIELMEKLLRDQDGK